MDGLRTLYVRSEREDCSETALADCMGIVLRFGATSLTLGVDKADALAEALTECVEQYRAFQSGLYG